MAFKKRNLRRIGLLGTADDGTSPGLYGMTTKDDWAAISAGGYFNAAAEDLQVGDQIMISADVDNTPQLRIVMVTANDGSTVTVAQVTNA